MEKLLFKHDLHFSHKSDSLLKFCEENHIVFLFVPAKCTDALQECDIVLNSPFKVSLRKCFRDWLHQSFEAHLAAGFDAHNWSPKLTYGKLKPLFPGWIDTAVASLRTLEMKQAIAKCFAENGQFALMRSEEQRFLARQRIVTRTTAPTIVIPPENEEDKDQIEDLIADDDELERDLVNDLSSFSCIALDDNEESDDEAEHDDEIEQDLAAQSADEAEPVVEPFFRRGQRARVPNRNLQS
jgi:hypothetical protein